MVGMKPPVSEKIMPKKAKTAGLTEFQRRVYDACSRIPRGRVATYASLAGVLGCGSPRAVGQALRRNPFAPEVPCHRVIRADFGIGGYSGATDGGKIARKLKLLAAEGVVFADGRLADPARVWPEPQ